jgi:hypothetical protein
VPSRNTDKDWVFENALSSGAVAALRGPPASVDLRHPWWDIGDQENTGSCVGWGSTDGVARYHFVKANRLAQNAKLSPRATWMASKETDQFTTKPETMIEDRNNLGGGRYSQVRRGPRNAAAFPHRQRDVHRR